jgi:hypothetical protein
MVGRQVPAVNPEFATLLEALSDIFFTGFGVSSEWIVLSFTMVGRQVPAVNPEFSALLEALTDMFFTDSGVSSKWRALSFARG